MENSTHMCEVVPFSSRGKEKASVRDVIQQSLADDPIARYIIRESQLPRFWDGMMSVYWSNQPQELHLMTQGCESVVFARFHPQDKVSGWRSLMRDLCMVPSGKLLKLPAALGLGAKMDKEQAHFEREVGPYVYVYILGTRPDCQNRGLGSALMKHIHAIADSRELSCYLESSSEGSRRLYERLGYHVREAVYMDKGAPPLYLMSRPASGAGHSTNAAEAAGDAAPPLAL